MAALRPCGLAVSQFDRHGYGACPKGLDGSCEGEVVADTIQEGDLKAAIAAGAAISDVLVVVRQPPGLGMFFVPYLQFTSAISRADGSAPVPGKEWVAIRTWRGRSSGVRSWRNYSTLLEQLVEWGFQARHTVYFDGDAALADLGIRPPPAD